MIKLTNVSGRKIDIAKGTSIAANNYITGDITVTPRIEQLLQMGLLVKEDVSYEKKDVTKTSYVSQGDMRRQKVMENIKSGYTKPSINLDNIQHTETSTETKTTSRGRKKNK